MIFASNRFAAAAMCLGISLLALPVRAAAPADEEQTGRLAGGGTYVVRRNPTVGVAVVELWFRAPSAGYERSEPGIARLALTAVAASRTASGHSLAELIVGTGGQLSINAYPDMVSIAASVPSSRASSIVHAMTAAYFTPQITEDGMKTALRDTAIYGAESQFDADRTLHDRLLGSLFADGPQRVAPVPPDVTDLSKITLSDATAFADRAFRAQNAILTLAGNVERAALAVVDAGRSGPPADPPIDSKPQTPPIPPAEAKSPVPGVGFGYIGPPIARPREATALDFVADYLFNPQTGTVSRELAADPDVFVSGQFVTLHDPGVFIVTVSGKGAAAARDRVLGAIGALTKPIDAQAFTGARNAFAYHILSDLQSPLSRADNAGWYAAQGDAAYAPGDRSGDYLQSVASLDPGFVAQTVRTYLQNPAVVQLIPAPSPAPSQQGNPQ